MVTKGSVYSVAISLSVIVVLIDI